MAKWTYRGPAFGGALQLPDGSLVFPNIIKDDAAIDDLIAKYPTFAHYWERTDADGDGIPDEPPIYGGQAIDLTPIVAVVRANAVYGELLLNTWQQL